MVLMTTADLADGLNDLENPYTALTTASTHRELAPGSAALPIRFVQRHRPAPTAVSRPSSPSTLPSAASPPNG